MGNNNTEDITDDKQVVNRPGQFQPGQSGNPNGRPPKGYSITETIRDMMAAKPEIKQALGTKIVGLALAGDINAMRMIWNYMDGMPIQNNVLTGDKDNPITVDIGSTLSKIYGQARTGSTGKVLNNSKG